MSWIPYAAWGGALVVAIVVLGFCAYELVWKAHRLQADLGRLSALAPTVQALQAQVAATQQRAADTGRS